ncbi:response regulator transcription factor [Actinomadura rubrisoli]|uniref:Response regulator transcription factor n=1 Tax=Actinomadura rubrisoli TaxID=2530368 RepID=A0A4R5B772_9ACTN|nr:LuxR C-terminal-related transcriptional regulator [Actinomadura rubrisoli]TDD81751.1 response regulator transcription factor [Actinomadura rubrisoli]
MATTMYALPLEDYGRPLTSRENQVLVLVAEALSNRRIARTLGISEKTVKNHLGSIYAKLGVGCRMEAALIALRSGAPAIAEPEVPGAPVRDAGPRTRR